MMKFCECFSALEKKRYCLLSGQCQDISMKSILLVILLYCLDNLYLRIFVNYFPTFKDFFNYFHLYLLYIVVILDFYKNSLLLIFELSPFMYVDETDMFVCTLSHHFFFCLCYAIFTVLLFPLDPSFFLNFYFVIQEEFFLCVWVTYIYKFSSASIVPFLIYPLTIWFDSFKGHP